MPLLQEGTDVNSLSQPMGAGMEHARLLTRDSSLRTSVSSPFLFSRTAALLFSNGGKRQMVRLGREGPGMGGGWLGSQAATVPSPISIEHTWPVSDLTWTKTQEC